MHDVVTCSLGPNGRAVILQRAANTQEVSRDGVTIAEETYSPNTWTNMGMNLVREASQKANLEAGDATTTAIVLAHSMCKEGLQAVEGKANVYQLSKGMKKAVEICTTTLQEISKPVSTLEDFWKVATVATQDEEIGHIIANTYMNAGTYGTIDIERNDNPIIESEKTDGLSFDKGWEHKQAFKCYLTDPKKKRCEMEDVPILVVEKKIENQEQLIPLMQKLAGTLDQGETLDDRQGWPEKTRKMLVVCDDFSGSAMALLIVNNQMTRFQDGIYKPFPMAFVQAPSYGVHKIEILKDICAVTGATFISEEHGSKRIEYVTLADLGRAKKVIIEDKRTIIIAEESVEQKKHISDRLELLQAQLNDMPKDHIDRKELEIRLATLTDGVSVLKVGADSEAERHELKRRVEDGVRAVKSAREEGVTPGCGVGLLSCIDPLTQAILLCTNADQKKGMEIVRTALYAVALRLLEVAFIERFDLPLEERATMSPEEQRLSIVERMRKEGLGYDFEEDVLADMLERGVFDAKKAVRVALEAAASCAMTFLKLGAAVSEVNDAEDLFEKISLKLK